MDISQRLLDSLAPERAKMIDTGAFKDIIQGYLLLTLEGLYYPEEKITEALHYSSGVLDTYSATEAIQEIEKEKRRQWQRKKPL